MFFAYFILVLLPYVNINLKTPKVAPWHWLGVHGPYFSRSGFVRVYVSGCGACKLSVYLYP